MDNLLAFLKSALYFAGIGLLLLMAAAATGCSLEVDDHTHDHGLGEHEHQLPSHTHKLLEHEHAFTKGGTSGALIVSIDPPVEEGVPADVEIDDKTNIGVLSRIGWQPITIEFSEKPQNLRVELRGFGDDVMSKWTLEDRVLTIRVFCDARAFPDHIYSIHVNWNSGFIALNYFCPPK